MKNLNNELKTRRDECGYSLIELLIVIALITILCGLSVFYLTAHTRLLKVEDQALRALDIFQEAKQRALTQKRLMRLEVNLTKNAIRLIDENGSGVDFEVKRLNLETSDVEVGTQPGNVISVPDALAGAAMSFTASAHPLSTSDNVAVIKFTSTGKVQRLTGQDAAGEEEFTDVGVNGGTFFVWQPNKNAPGNSDMTRAITVVATTGVIRLWDYEHNANTWKERH